jgi:hypothetical protein
MTLRIPRDGACPFAPFATASFRSACSGTRASSEWGPHGEEPRRSRGVSNHEAYGDGSDGGALQRRHQKEYHRDRRFTRNQNGKRKVVVIVRERGGNSVPAVFHSESQASAFIRSRIAKGTVVHADEAGSWDNLHERFEVKRINHQEAYSLDGACTNQAEEYFSRLRRAEIGIHHHIAGAYLLRSAQESSWREDNRRVSNGDPVNRIILRSWLKAVGSAEDVADARPCNSCDNGFMPVICPTRQIPKIAAAASRSEIARK